MSTIPIGDSAKNVVKELQEEINSRLEQMAFEQSENAEEMKELKVELSQKETLNLILNEFVSTGFIGEENGELVLDDELESFVKTYVEGVGVDNP